MNGKMIAFNKISGCLRCLILLWVMIGYGCVTESPIEEYHPYAQNARLRILAIGNSFTENATTYMPELLQNLYSGEDVFFCKLTKGGTSLQDHWTYYIDNTTAYTLAWTVGGEWNNIKNVTLNSALNMTNWDIVVIQQLSGLAGCADSFFPYLDQLTTIFRTHCKGVQIGWQMTWAYASSSTHNDFYRYDCDRTKMYTSIEDALTYVTPYVNVIIPSGELIERLRATKFNTPMDFTVDGYHLETGLPCFALSCLVHEVLIAPYTSVSCLGNQLRPKGAINVTDEAAETIWSLIKGFD